MMSDTAMAPARFSTDRSARATLLDASPRPSTLIVRKVRKICGVMSTDRRNPTGFSRPSRIRERMKELRTDRTKQRRTTTWNPPTGNLPAIRTCMPRRASSSAPPRSAPNAGTTPAMIDVPRHVRRPAPLGSEGEHELPGPVQDGGAQQALDERGHGKDPDKVARRDEEVGQPAQGIEAAQKDHGLPARCGPSACPTRWR